MQIHTWSHTLPVCCWKPQWMKHEFYSFQAHCSFLSEACLNTSFGLTKKTVIFIISYWEIRCVWEVNSYMEFRTQADLWTLMFTCWRLEAKWWRLSVVFFVCYSSINTVLINNVTGAQCAWLSWGLIPNCQYCTDEALSMCMLGFLALWASLCMSV